MLDAWHYLGTVTTLTAARKLKGEPLGFDRDSYRIIRAAIESGLHAITVLGPSRLFWTTKQGQIRCQVMEPMQPGSVQREQWPRMTMGEHWVACKKLT